MTERESKDSECAKQWGAREAIQMLFIDQLVGANWHLAACVGKHHLNQTVQQTVKQRSRTFKKD